VNGLNFIHLPLSIIPEYSLPDEEDSICAMKTINSDHTAGFQTLEVLCFLMFLVGPRVFAQSPSSRIERIQHAQVRSEENRSAIREWAQQRGAEIRHDDGERILEIMAIRDGRPVYNATYNDSAAISSGAAGVRNAPPFNTDGAGVTVGVWDAGSVMTNHQELVGRVIASDVVRANYHSSHVGGTIAASGVRARAEGMAPAALIRSYDWTSDELEMIFAAASSPLESGKLQISNHSYGILAGWFYAGFTNPWTRRSGYHWWGDINDVPAEAYFGQYGSAARYWDEIIYNAPYFLSFKAAGNERDDGPADGTKVYYSPDDGDTWTNTIYDSTLHPLGDGTYKDGYDNIPYRGNAKNIMTIGAVYDAVTDGSRDPAGATNTVFTSWGPADDGRIKPDIVANGYQLYSCNTANTSSYASRSGTSMASPNACGSAALLIDYYDNRFPGEAMRASTLKGLIIHTADDLGRPGPDYQFGWGLMNTSAAAELLKRYADGNLISLNEALLSATNSPDSYTGFSDSGTPVCATLCWTDPPGTATTNHDSRIPVLVNDLDLKITGPDGVHYPFTLSYTEPDIPARSDIKNSIDNVEQVYIHTPNVGEYTVSVHYDGELQNNQQHYSLLISGLVSDQDGDVLPDYWESTYFTNITNALTTADPDGDGMDNLSEYLSGTDPTDPTSIFGIAAVESLYSTGHPPFVLTWDGKPGRIYKVSWTYNIIYLPFAEVSGDIHGPASSYTDVVDRIGAASYYRLDVRMHD
jgi:hypothetical protein